MLSLLSLAPLVAASSGRVVVELGYLVAAILFIFGLKGLTHPRSAVRGNLLGAMGMGLAVLAALLAALWGLEPFSLGTLWVALAGAVVGGVIGAVLAKRVEMPDMPQLVALFNGFGGLASVFVAGGALMKSPLEVDALVATGVSALIGAVTFSGSLLAFAKLQELKAFKKPLRVPGQHVINALLAVLCVLATIGLAMHVSWLYIPLVLLALVLGVLLVGPIGGADMPVVIALLNSYSGLAAAATGFVINNNVLIISGSLVGASGVILTKLMCKAMNRSLFNVLFGVMGGEGQAKEDLDEIYKTVKVAAAEDVAILLDRRNASFSFPVTAWRSPKLSTRFAIWDGCWKRKASRSNTRSTPWPAACRDT